MVQYPLGWKLYLKNNNNNQQIGVDEDEELLETSDHGWRVKGTVAAENNMGVPQKFKHRITT